MEPAGLASRVIEVMCEEDLQTLLGWAGSEGWNPGGKDAGPFRIADAGGFFAVKGEGGELVAGISAVRYGETYGFIGLYICAPEFRGRGHGTAVFRRAMAHLEGRTIGLDAVPAQQTTYTNYGFVLAHRTVRFGGEMPTSSPPTTEAGEEGNGVDVFALKEDHVEMVVAFDGEHFPACREDFTRAWLTTTGHVVRTAMKNGVVQGYGVLRPCVDGAKIGPLFASSADVAEVLARALAASAAEAATASGTVRIMLDVPDPNKQGVQLAERLDLTEMCQTGRMYRGPAPELPLNRIFGVTNLELG